MPEPLRIAFIGAVGHVDIVMEGLRSLPDCRVVGVARGEPQDRMNAVLDADPVRRDGPPVFDDYRRMLDQVRPDVACVFLRYHRNAEACIATAEHGCHVACEKPLATELADLERLREAVGRANVRLVALLGMRYETHILAAQQAVRKGLIGEPILAFAQKSYKFGTRPEWYRDRCTFGGTIPWVAIHAIDFTRFVTGLDYVSVRALHANKAHPDYPGLEDAGALLLEMSNGGQATITFDYLRPGKADTHGDDRIRVAGSKGVIEVRLADDFAEATTNEQAHIELPHTGQRNLFADFVAEIRGQGRALLSQEDSFRAVEVALKAREAADTGRTVSLV